MMRDDKRTKENRVDRSFTARDRVRVDVDKRHEDEEVHQAKRMNDELTHVDETN
ncbi:hypothetical protein [Halalkalibacterium halodurans]|nr:hypothetical protein [Halalkalibacterium halodurans]